MPPSEAGEILLQISIRSVLQLFHQREFAFGARKIAAALRLRHAFEIAERLEGADLQTEIAAHLADIARASR